MNLSARVIAYLWLTKEKIKAAWMRRKTARICREVDRSIAKKMRRFCGDKNR